MFGPEFDLLLFSVKDRHFTTWIPRVQSMELTLAAAAAAAVRKTNFTALVYLTLQTATSLELIQPATRS